MERAQDVHIPAGATELRGDLVFPEQARGLVMFAHGSGSSRLSPRNMQVAAALRERRLATLLFDLLTPAEEGDRGNVFDIGRLARRLIDATHWAQAEPDVEGLPIGYFGASTGSAAALIAAAEIRHGIAAVVSRGGRPDLAVMRLRRVTAPTLLIVGGLDVAVLQLNEEARAQLRCSNELALVPGATHLFEEPGALQQVADLAGDWFERHLVRPTVEAAKEGSQQ
jgi:putative phosphoribosyl transferase